ncbi:hypothetical protein F511_34830 [Dorcoceras hygrometricum]|uniref:DUF4219 domain-containing protein n=1 Tax=Dorcoceras hygrometricum TaxID=472368 RepID=A0A2Z7D0Y7_9LAMI|nr:hypothetical protein F511_34830 [Dorcoceras hygrometricum]
MFSKEEYNVWKIRMQAHLAVQDDDMWFVITNGPMQILKMNTAVAITAGAPQWIEKPRLELTSEDKKKANLDNVVKFLVISQKDVALIAQLEPISTYSSRMVCVYYQNDDVGPTSSTTSRYLNNQQSKQTLLLAVLEVDLLFGFLLVYPAADSGVEMNVQRTLAFPPLNSVNFQHHVEDKFVQNVQVECRDMPPRRTTNRQTEQGSTSTEVLNAAATPMETFLKRFQSFKPPTLTGTESAIDCENWLEDIDSVIILAALQQI